jgi:hypothetical protein
MSAMLHESMGGTFNGQVAPDHPVVYLVAGKGAVQEYA